MTNHNSHLRTILLNTLILFSLMLRAQVATDEARTETVADSLNGWHKGGVMGLSFSQASFTNWSAGGESSIAINSFFTIYANYKKQRKLWENALDVGYGFMKQGENADYRKTNDKFYLMSKYGQQISEKFYVTALLDFKTQMAVGKRYDVDSVKISNFLAPAYLIGSFGAEYKPSGGFSAYFAPITSKFTFVNDPDLANKGAFGLEGATYDNGGSLISEGKRYRRELGGYVRLIFAKNNFETDILKNVSLTTQLDLFSNYLKSPQNIDVNWETQIVFNVNKFLSFNINMHLFYDDDVMIAVDENQDGITDGLGPRLQFKEILGIGVSYKY